MPILTLTNYIKRMDNDKLAKLDSLITKEIRCRAGCKAEKYKKALLKIKKMVMHSEQIHYFTKDEIKKVIEIINETTSEGV